MLDVEVLAADGTWRGHAGPCTEFAATSDRAGFAFPPGRNVEALDARRSLGPACRVWAEGMGCAGCETSAASLAPACTFRDVDRDEDGFCAKPELRAEKSRWRDCEGRPGGWGCAGCETWAASLAPACTFRDVDRGEDGCCTKPELRAEGSRGFTGTFRDVGWGESCAEPKLRAEESR